MCVGAILPRDVRTSHQPYVGPGGSQPTIQLTTYVTSASLTQGVISHQESDLMRCPGGGMRSRSALGGIIGVTEAPLGGSPKEQAPL